MTNPVENAIYKVATAIAANPCVRAVGWSGGERALPQPGEGDIDLFIYCTHIPQAEQRRELLESLHENVEPFDVGGSESKHWGMCDRCCVCGIETWLLYFTVAEARTELEDILTGKHLGREDNDFYPLGRCAMWNTMRALYDPDGVLRAFKYRLKIYPPQMAEAVVSYHLEALNDVENLERATRWKDVLFYHFALDLALDHFLQAMFALNNTYFPSRKRSGEFIEHFQVKPPDCTERLRQAVAWGSHADTLATSYQAWKQLVCELRALVESLNRS
ncbi:MAG: DUF4037 domain-containing protein [Anaerolineaceae bacterium]|nr:DUF4037 domain-containing protein [Anaerolineaceae bacterium]